MSCRFLLLLMASRTTLQTRLIISMLQSRKILLGITGSIAAYKAILLVRLLVKAGAEVKVIMTPAAREFVSPVVLSTLSRNRVAIDLADGNEWENHVMLGRWADVFVIAPLSCNTMSKMAHGACDNLLLAVYLSAVCPVVVAPAMDEDMWHHPATKKNLEQLISYGNHLISVNNGELASGLVGEGRMAEPDEIVQYLESQFFRGTELKGKKALVTAGPTYEAIDPVRFVGNHSSGKMGFAIAEALYQRGADVTLVSGPTHQTVNFSGIKVVKVTSAADMLQACESHFTNADITVMAAAVADYSPAAPAAEKIKKKDDNFDLSLKKTTDILKQLGKQKKAGQYLMGFALETQDEHANALAKLKAKNLDAIVLNSLRDKGAGFGVDTNRVTIIGKDGEAHQTELKSKQDIAASIVSYIIANYA